MLRFFAIILYALVLFGAFYAATATIVSGSLPPSIIAYTNSTSLNHSLFNFNHRVDGYVVGSSVALRNIDAEILTSELGQEFHVLGGFGMKPLETLQLLTETQIQNKTVIIPLSIGEINYLPTPPQLNWNSLRLKNLADFLKDREIDAIPKNQVGHVQFNSFGNAFFPTCENGMVMPVDRYGEVLDPFRIDSADYRNYFEQLSRVQKRQKLKLLLVFTPYSTNYGNIIPGEIPMMQQMFSECNNDSLLLFDFSYDELDFEYFIDFVHMSDIGARAFTKELAMELKMSAPVDRN